MFPPWSAWTMKKIKGLQYFSDEYLKSVRHCTSEQILKFLDDFRQLNRNPPAASADKPRPESSPKGVS